jgi:GTPase SAR1 family protein
VTIIIEGPDGAGKTTLLSDLAGHFPAMEQHPRFCTSTGGPLDNLAELVFKDAQPRPTHYFYDRHPCISEYIYRTALGQSIPSAFLGDAMGRIRNRLAHHSLTIWCLPPLDTVIENVHKEEQMPGVDTNIGRIYQQYQMHRLMWPGRSVVYDYTNSALSWEALRYALSDTRDKLWKEHP